jgi:pectin methylesterase-like acyl-CoA thioesterase
MPTLCLTAIALAVAVSPVQAAAGGAVRATTGSVPIALEKDEVLPPEIKTPLGVMPGPNQLPERKEMPDVLTMNDGTKVTAPQQWAKRREEMRKVLEYYGVGQAPPAPDNLKATVVKTQEVGTGKFMYRLVHLTFGPHNACSLDFGLWTPISGPPVGVIICPDGSAPGAPILPRMPQGVNQGRGQDVLSVSLAPLPTEPPVPTGGGMNTSGRGSDPESATTNQILTRGYAYVTYNTGDCAEDTTARMPDGTFAFRTTRFFPAYPNYDWGVLRAWAWGASRIIDYLMTDPAIDTTKIAITGVSRSGKSALIAGAFDERITLTAPIASSGGGTPAFRFSGFEHGGNEGLSEMVRKYPNWFSPRLHEFFHQAWKLPFDNHWYLAMCAPRAVIALEGTRDQNVNKYGVRQSFLAARPAFELLGVKDHLAVNWADRPHALVQDDWDSLFAFADKVWNNQPVTRSFDEFPEIALTPPAATLRLVSVSPAPQATDVCIDTPLRLTFDGPPALAASGVIQILDESGMVIDSIDVSARTASKTIGGLPNFNYYPVVITGNEVVIAFKNGILAYDKTYEVKVPAGLFVDKEGDTVGLDTVKTWRFSTRKAAPSLPTEGPRRIIIAADGTGDFATVQGALDFVPAGNAVPTTLFVRKGTYCEIVYFSDKHNLTILGEDRKGSIITYANNQALNNTDRTVMPGGYRRGMVRAVNCTDLTISRLTLHNTTPQGGGQAEAIILHGGMNARAIITDVDMYSRQDTLQVNGQAYISNCYIEGDVDFMWGTGPCFFENCQLRALRNKSMYTQIRNPPTNRGYIYKSCTFEGAPGITDCILSRVLQTRFPASEVVLLDCTLTSAVSPVGWRLDGPGEAPSIHFWEYNSRDPNGKPIDDSMRFAVSRRLTREADAEIIANYSNPVWVLGGDWDPRLAPIFSEPQAPASDAAPVTLHPSQTGRTPRGSPVRRR